MRKVSLTLSLLVLAAALFIIFNSDSNLTEKNPVQAQTHFENVQKRVQFQSKHHETLDSIKSTSAHPIPTKLNLPNSIKVKSESQKSPHATPPSLLAFASQMADQMDTALKNEEFADQLMNQLAMCAQDSVGVVQAVRSSCAINAFRLSAKYPARLREKYEQLKSHLSSQTLTLMRASGFED